MLDSSRSSRERNFYGIDCCMNPDSTHPLGIKDTVVWRSIGRIARFLSSFYLLVELVTNRSQQRYIHLKVQISYFKGEDACEVMLHKSSWEIEAEAVRIWFWRPSSGSWRWKRGRGSNPVLDGLLAH